MADIPISAVTRRVQYTVGGSDTGPYSFTFNVLADTDLAVYLNSTLKTITTHYTVSLNANGTGSITLVSSPLTTDIVTIISAVPIARTSDYTTSGDFTAAAVNADLDKQTIFSQQLSERIDRSLKSATSESEVTDWDLPSPTADKGLKWNSAGTALENTTEDVDGIATAAAASAAAALVSENAAAADAALTAADVISTAADLVATNQDTIDTAADVVSTGNDVTSTNADVVTTAAHVVSAESAAGAVAVPFTFDASTSMADPGTGDFRFNNATVASVTAITLDANSADTGNPDVSDFIATWGASSSAEKGHITFKKSGTPATFATFKITAAVTDNTTHLELTVTHVDSNGTWTAADKAYVAWTRTGDAGAAVDLTAPGPIGSVTPSTGAFTTLTATTALAETSGGTGQSTFTAGDILYADGANSLAKLAKGSDAEILTLASGVPSWAAAASDTGFNQNIGIINGDFQVSQRSTSKTGVGGTSGYFVHDRWAIRNVGSASARFTWSQETLTPGTDAPTDSGFRTSAKLDCTTADASPGAGELLEFRQAIEGRNVQMLGYGDSNAQSLTVSFWHKHTKTGNHVVTLFRAGGAEWASVTYTQSTTNTWELATVTFDPNTSNALDNDTSEELTLIWPIYGGTTYSGGTPDGGWSTTANKLAGGQVNNADSTSNNWEITGIKMELGTSVTTYQHESYGDTLAKCQRYYWLIEADEVSGTGLAVASHNTTDRFEWQWDRPVTGRTGNPTVTVDNVTNIRVVGATNLYATTLNSSQATLDFVMIQCACTGATAGNAARVMFTNTNIKVHVDDEL